MSKSRQLADLGNVYDDGALSNRNLIINGDFSIWQRGTSSTSTGWGYHTADRWNTTLRDGAGTMSQYDMGAELRPFTYALKTAITSAATSSPAIQQKIEDIRLTLFRQGMFAQFEWQMHQKVQAQEPLTASSLSRDYLALNMEYCGKSLEFDEFLSIEWARIPHFYASFYVYQYATGISAALSMASNVLKTGQTQAYLDFLKAGGSEDPLVLLKQAGVEIKDAVGSCIEHFASLLSQFEKEMQF